LVRLSIIIKGICTTQSHVNSDWSILMSSSCVLFHSVIISGILPPPLTKPLYFYKILMVVCYKSADFDITCTVVHRWKRIFCCTLFSEPKYVPFWFLKPSAKCGSNIDTTLTTWSWNWLKVLLIAMQISSSYLVWLNRSCVTKLKAGLSTFSKSLGSVFVKSRCSS